MIFICPKCGFEIKTSRQKHVLSCDGFGPRRRSICPKKGKGWSKGSTLSEEHKNKISKSLKGKSKGIASSKDK